MPSTEDTEDRYIIDVYTCTRLRAGNGDNRNSLRILRKSHRPESEPKHLKSPLRHIQAGAFYTSRKIPRLLFRIFNSFIPVSPPGAAQKHTLKNYERYTCDIARKHTLTHTKQSRQNMTTDCLSDDKACFVVTYHAFIKFLIVIVRTVSV